MTKLQPITQLVQQLNVPIQDLAQLSFCDGTRDSSVKAWVRSLPLTQVQFVSGLLYQALPDVGRFQTTPGNRIQILESLRNSTLQSIEGLTQNFLNQPLILPEPAVKTATIAQALQKHMINGYLVAIRDLCNQANANTDLITLAIHRAITGLSLLLLRYYQLYVPISGQLWAELHSLYQIALQLGVTENTVVDDHPHLQHCNTITLAYMRALLLACARPNQLRQDEILSTFEALNELSTLAQLHDPQTGNHDNLFAVALNSNRPPLYRSRFAADENSLLLELNTAQICKKLTEINAATNSETLEGTSLRNELQLTSALTLHLIQAWNLLAQRNFERQESQGALDVAVGLSNIHYQLAGQMNFTHFLNRTIGTHSADNNTGSIFQKRGVKLKNTAKQNAKDDPWNDAFDISGTSLAGRSIATDGIEFAIKKQEAEEFKDANPIYHVPLIDSSPGGYCIEWRDEIPSQVKAGELLGLRDPLRNRWSLGVVRWANQTKGATQLGIQILAASATPVGLAMIHKTGDTSEYLRALEIPPLKAINQPTTLITNAVSFREYSKARIYKRTNDGSDTEQKNIQLTRRLFATGAISQFTYRELATGKPKETAKNDDFDSIWDS
jgi:urease accessory protein UreF